MDELSKIENSEYSDVENTQIINPIFLLIKQSVSIGYKINKMKNQLFWAMQVV